jgi:putative NADH-flavin reductase
MKVVVFGANGPTGRLVTKQAIAGGHAVTAVTRHPETFPLRGEGLRVMRGDVFDPESVDEAVAGQDAVLSTLGVPYRRKEITVYSQGAANILRAMRAHGVRRFACVSSSATVPHADPEGGFIFERMVQPFVTGVIGRTLYEDMRRMETLVQGSDVDWVIVRPSGLFDTPAVTDYHVAESHIRGHFTSRADLADVLLRQLTDDRFVHKALAVATVSEHPSMLQLIWKEGISKRT